MESTRREEVLEARVKALTDLLGSIQEVAEGPEDATYKIMAIRAKLETLKGDWLWACNKSLT